MGGQGAHMGSGPGMGGSSGQTMGAFADGGQGANHYGAQYGGHPSMGGHGGYGHQPGGMAGGNACLLYTSPSPRD